MRADALLHRRVLDRCRRHPERPAVGALTYGDLDGRSGALAARVVAALDAGDGGGHPGLDGAPLVAVFARPSADGVVALLATLRAGAAYLPLDPDWPDARVAQVLEVAAPAATITTGDLRDRAAALAAAATPSAPVFVVDDRAAADGPDRHGEWAWVLFTSGSTGRPKGVKVRQRAAMAFLGWVERAFGVTETDRFAHVSSLAFDASVRQVFSPLLAGGTVHPAAGDLVRDPDALAAWIRRERLTVWNSVPSLLAPLLDAGRRATGPDPFASLRWVLIGGDAFSADLARRAWEALPAARIANLYGATETVVNATWHLLDAPPSDGALHTPIGRARAGVGVHLDAAVDGVGEIVVSGAIADGYLGDPASAAGAFVDDPRRGRLYRTGDLARRAPDGALVFVGRRDGQVQVRGNRVELSEIEHTLANHPDVDQAVVVFEDERLIATAQPRPGAAPDGPALRRWVAERLPAYMVPHRVGCVAALPRTAAGKLARSAPAGTAPGPAAVSAAAPADDALGLVRTIWREVLRLDALPVPGDDFFSLGGDSLRILDVMEALRERAGVHVRPMVLYEHQELTALARAVAGHRAATAALARPEAPPQDGPYPLTSVQRGFYTAQRAAGGRAPASCVQVPIHGDVDRAAFQAALDWLVARHEQLRTVFRDTPRGPVQETLPAAPATLQVDDLSGIPAARHAWALGRLWELQRAVEFAPDRGPLFAVRLVHLAPGHHALFLAAHHIIADAWSSWLMAGELLHAHDRLRQGDAPTLPPPSLRFRDVVAREETVDDRWWRGYLAGYVADGPAAPASRSIDDAAFDGAAGEDAVLALPPESWRAFQAASRERAVSPFVLALSALFETLGQALAADGGANEAADGGAGARAGTGRTDDLVIATALAGRDSTRGPEAHVVGAFARALPIRVRGPVTVEAVARSFGQALAHSAASQASILAGAAGAAPDRVAALGRFFFTWLDPQAAPAPPSGLRVDWEAGRYAFAAETTRTELMVSATVGEGLRLRLYGGPLAARIAPALREALDRLAGRAPVTAALVVYAPAGVRPPLSEPIVVERVDTSLGASELVLLPLGADQLDARRDLPQLVRRAAQRTRARVVALAGMLPSLTGLAARGRLGDGQILTTGHAATVVAMVHNLRRALDATGRRWTDATVGVLGYGSIGRATLALARHRLGEPAGILLCDPHVPESVRLEGRAQVILGATSGGATLDVAALPPGTVVVDDSFPQAFLVETALLRMRRDRDVLLVGGGTLDAGPLTRTSPFAEAAAVREAYGARWLPGCHAEALLVAHDPTLGPTVGPVSVERALQLWGAVERAGWTAPPLHLGTWVVPEDVLAAVAAVVEAGKARTRR